MMATMTSEKSNDESYSLKPASVTPSGGTTRGSSNDEGYSLEFATVSCTAGSSGGTAESFLGGLISTNMRKVGFPEILAVDCEEAAKDDLKRCMDYVGNFMINSDRVVPHLLRFTLHTGDGQSNPNDSVYFASLQVTNPKQLDMLYPTSTRPASCDMVLLLMPIVPRAPDSSSNGLLWGHLPNAPENNTLMRDTIKAELEDHVVTCGIVRSGNSSSSKRFKGQGGRYKTKKATTTIGRVTLREALLYSDWNIERQNGSFKEREIKYMKKHAEHFIAMSIDGIDAAVAGNYIDQVCSSSTVVDDTDP